MRYAISDIHGCSKTFRKLVEKKLQLNAADELYLLGDYIDKGPDSKGVLDYMMELSQSNIQVFVLRGNREQMFLSQLEQGFFSLEWLSKGGAETLKSFNAKKVSDIPLRYKVYLKKMRYYVEDADNIYVHAGFDFSKDNIFEITPTILTIKKFRVNPHKCKQKRIIHGHVPHSLSDIKKRLNESIFHTPIDGGCIYKERKGMGNLIGLCVDNMKLFVQPNIDK